ncbi:3-phosphoshikimate 1-carboxyvinyltransferase [Seinonella peptonophila]|uniref:3-phosphoshikimate 1-carboxyvinyltransferase n=1 Tax=Seinonella peptonophila TaxID=112248 RepID=A0A1M4WFU9_9BACL|nr:3-phosphoshikimate 1-carboxyvinyltransferase [Seinonella peptonophila]SHE80128.1 3-phosphoshikimate 1-carboxyvinyltransferase [Seinonella peptonophila]
MSQREIVQKIEKPFQISMNLPGSKSVTLRNYLLAALADGTSYISAPGLCDDTDRMEDSLQRLGVKIDTVNGEKIIQGQNGHFAEGEIGLELGLSAASTRLLIALAALRSEKTSLDGEAPLRARPNKYLLDALVELGADVSSTQDGFMPLTVQGSSALKQKVTMRGDRSSQYFSALLIIAPLLPNGLHLYVDGELVSKPYVDITIQEMEKFGVKVENDRYQHFYVAPQSYRGTNLTVEGDASASSYFSALATIHGGTVTFKNLGTSTKQGDIRFLEVCEKLGAKITYQENRVTIQGPKVGELPALTNEIDMENMPDVAPTLMAMAPFIPGKTKITGLSTLRIKECDRIAVPAAQLHKLGVQVTEGPDWIEIDSLPISDFRQEVEIETFDDHRIAMSFAVLGTKLDHLQILEPDCVNKTYPHFWQDLNRLYG